jgi:PAS domain S-box-containing protein
MAVPISRGLELHISQDSLRLAIVISILSVWVLIGLFTYLNRYTKRNYFTLWTVAWLFYGLWLSLNYGLLKYPENPLLMMFKQWCVGVAATFLLWGSFRFLGLKVHERLLGLFIGFLFVWSYVGSYKVDEPIYIQAPIFGLIGLASALTSICFFRYRRQKSFIGAALLGFGFLLWGGYFAGYPFFQKTDELAASGFFISAVLQLFIAVSMIILVLEEVRHANNSVFDRLRSHRSENRVLRTKVVSTEERYRSLFDQASEAIIITSTKDFRIFELNATAQRLLGIARSESGKHFLPAFCQPAQANSIPPTGGVEWVKWVSNQTTLKLVRKNGGSANVEIDGAPIQFDGKPAFQFFIREITERTRLEQQLRQAEKLSALGQMISGVAHELNNPLAVIKGYLELVLAHHDLSPQTRADLQKVSQESTRAAKLVRSFLAFAHEQPAHREMVDLNEIVQRVTELRAFALRDAKVQLTLQLEEGLPQTCADPDQVQQIVSNLITNAFQAMGKNPQPHRMRISSRIKNDQLALCVEDNGPGVPVELEQRIFEPFFTTKEVGTGTGLGLSIAHSIMTEHNGRISYSRSTLGGAAFTLEFPIVSLPEQPRAMTPADFVKPTSGREESARARILILDDEEAIAELLREMLELLGHTATVCLNPMHALERVSREKFDLIISDFRMPGMNGREFHQQVQQNYPALAKCIVFLTGDVVTEDTRIFLENNGNPHLTKPFQLTALEQVINDVLTKNRRRLSGSEKA